MSKLECIKWERRGKQLYVVLGAVAVFIGIPVAYFTDSQVWQLMGFPMFGCLCLVFIDIIYDAFGKGDRP